MSAISRLFTGFVRASSTPGDSDKLKPKPKRVRRYRINKKLNKQARLWEKSPLYDFKLDHLGPYTKTDPKQSWSEFKELSDQATLNDTVVNDCFNEVIVVCLTDPRSRPSKEVPVFAVNPFQLHRALAIPTSVESSNLSTVQTLYAGGDKFHLKSSSVYGLIETVDKEILSSTGGLVSERISLLPHHYCRTLFPLIYSTFVSEAHVDSPHTLRRTFDLLTLLIDHGENSGFYLPIVDLNHPAYINPQYVTETINLAQCKGFIA